MELAKVAPGGWAGERRAAGGAGRVGGRAASSRWRRAGERRAASSRWRRAGGRASGEQQVRAAAPYRSPLRGGAGRVGGRAASSRWRRAGGRASGEQQVAPGGWGGERRAAGGAGRVGGAAGGRRAAGARRWAVLPTAER
eukprot:jgi/Tetstr1/456497/TSEL_043220.t1